jgi:hypothetical protein
MASVTRVACNKEGNGDGGKSNGYEGDRQATAMRVMAKVKATMTTSAVAVAEVATAITMVTAQWQRQLSGDQQRLQRGSKQQQK